MRYPSMIVGLAVDAERVQPLSGGGCAFEQLAAVGACALQGHRGEYTQECPLSCRGAEAWWRWLRGLLRARMTVWVVGWELIRALTLLGFWERLEMGEYRLSDDDPDAPEGSADGARPGWRGQCVVSDPPTVIVCRAGGHPGTIRMVDIRNYGWPSPPAGRTVQERALGTARLLAGWCGVLRARDLGGLQATAASQAWSAYRYRYLRAPVLCHAHPEALGLERAALYSGRCECYRIGRAEGPVCQLDARALYPALCVGQPVPARFKGYQEGGNIDIDRLEGQGHQVIARVDLDTRLPALPCRRDGVTYYPVGRWTAELCGPELRLAAALGAIRRVRAVAWYETSPILDLWARDVLGWRRQAEEEGRPDEAQVHKRLANSLLGRFAARRWRWVPCERPSDRPAWRVWTERCPDGGPYLHHRSIGQTVQHELPLGEQPESVPAVAAWIYSLARVRLWEWIRIAERSDVHYVDTDSLWVTRAGLRRLALAGEVTPGVDGRLRRVARHDWMEIYGLKRYETSEGVHVAGVPGVRRDPETGRYAWESSDRVEGALRDGRTPDGRVIRRSALLHQTYRHGLVGAGGAVSPWEVNDV